MNLTKRFTSRQLLWCPLVLIAIALVGCVDLSAIRRFADQAAETASYSDLTHYYISHYDRVARYSKIKPEDAAKHAADAEKRQKQELPLLGLQRGLVEYLNALATLASDQAVNYDQSLKGLADELKDSKLVTDSRADAFQSISSLLARAATDGYRRKKLKDFITQGNAPVQKLIDGLTNIVGVQFMREMDNERGAVEGYYDKIIAKATENDPATALVEDKKANDLDQIRARQAACGAYVAAMTKIAQAHQELYDRRDRLANAETLTLMYGYSQDVIALRQKLRQPKP
jgi:hypothetical protein